MKPRLKTAKTLALLRAHESRNVTFMEADGSWPIVWERARGVDVIVVSSGAIALALAHERNTWDVTAIDQSSAALAIARASEARHVTNASTVEATP